MNHPRDSYSRGQLAESTGVKGETIRYYEKCGLLEPPARSPGGHRMYTHSDAARLTFIRRCRQPGFSLNEIDGLIGLADGQKKPVSKFTRQLPPTWVMCKTKSKT